MNIDNLTEQEAKELLHEIKLNAESSEDARDYIMWVIEKFKGSLDG